MMEKKELEDTLQRQLDAQTSNIERRMDDLRAEMRVEMTELHSQNQLLLSKISALSSQNSNAPAIFEGADRRKLEAKQEQLRRSGQKVAKTVHQRQLAFFVSLHPLHLRVSY